MTVLEAFSPSDGWAILREGDRCWLLRPPYRLASLTPITAEAAYRLITQQVMPVSGEEFPDRGSLVGELLKRRQAAARAIDDATRVAAARDVLRHASVAQARQHMEFIAAELLPRQRFDEARRLLKVLLEAPAVVSDPQALQDLAGLLGRCAPAERLIEQADDPRMRWFARKRSDEVERQVRRVVASRQILAVPAIAS